MAASCQIPAATKGRTASRHLSLLWALLLSVFMCDCSRKADRTEAQRGLSPRQTVLTLIKAHQTGDYRQIAELTIPERADDVCAILAAVNRFLIANRQLCELVAQEVGPGVAQAIDHGHHAYYLDIFSKYVEVLDEDVRGDRATVAFLVDGQLPARRAELRLVNHAWRYDPGPGDYRQLAAAFTRMSEGLEQVYDGIRHGLLPVQTLREDPDRLIDEVRIRMLPGVKLLPPATQATTQP
jgi:hypothetical protein